MQSNIFEITHIARLNHVIMSVFALIALEVVSAMCIITYRCLNKYVMRHIDKLNNMKFLKR